MKKKDAAIMAASFFFIEGKELFLTLSQDKMEKSDTG